jgi:hypothetical protein
VSQIRQRRAPLPLIINLAPAQLPPPCSSSAAAAAAQSFHCACDASYAMRSHHGRLLSPTPALLARAPLCRRTPRGPSLFKIPLPIATVHHRHRLLNCCIHTPTPLMSSDSFWSDACNRAIQRPLQELLDATYASCIVTVSAPPAAAAVLSWGLPVVS